MIIGIGAGFVLLHHKTSTTGIQKSTDATTQNSTSSSDNTSPQSSSPIGSISGTKLSAAPTSSTTVSDGQTEKAIIQVLAVYDDASSGIAPQAGYKYDAILLKLTNENAKGNAIPGGDLLGNMSITGSDGNTYNNVAGVKNCPDIRTINAQVDQPVEGCLTITLPTTVNPTKLSMDFFNAGAGSNPQTSAEASWTVSR